MADQDNQNQIDNIEIEPLSDEALEEVAGGALPSSSNGCCSCEDCSSSTPPAT